MKNTAVETLVEWLEDFYGKELSSRCAEHIKQAKELERQQIIEAHGDKKKFKSEPNSIVTYGYTYTGEMYYNETFNTNK